jgi:hypothetical protein
MIFMKTMSSYPSSSYRFAILPSGRTGRNGIFHYAVRAEGSPKGELEAYSIVSSDTNG